MAWTEQEMKEGFILPEGSNTTTNQNRIAKVSSERSSAMKDVTSTYDKMISQSDQFYQNQINAAKEYAETQKKNQQEQTDFAIEQIEQQKEQAKQDYTKEQSGAYVDWQKQSGQYGANAEAMASMGMGNTGYSESSQVSMYNQYQSRVATARESYNRAVLNYDNAIKDARLQNNAALAEIAYNALQTQLELSLEGFQYKNSLIIAKSDKQMEVDNQYWGRYQDVLNQINTENSLAEDIRQFNEKMAEEKRQYNASLALQKEQLAEEKRQFNVTQAAKKSSGGSSGGSIRRSSGGSGGGSVKKKGTTGNGWVSTGSGRVSTGNNVSGSTKIDTQSIIDLGLGPVSAETLNRYVSMGYVNEYNKNGTLTFKTSPKTNKLKKLYSGG